LTNLMPSVDRRRVCLGRKPNKGRIERKMIYLMPIDECPHCGARTPRIESHRCPKVEQNGRFGDKLAAEHQTWIASQLATAQSRSPERTTTDLQGAIRVEPTLSTTAKRHLIGLVEELSRPSQRALGAV
jgi:hypothetical protein